MDIISFSYVDFPRLRPLKAWIMKERGIPSYVRTTPIIVLEAFSSTTKVLLKLGAAKMGVVHMAFFNVVKAYSASCV
jgi:hypothetical protein